jgi:hypothetical protein
MALDVVVSGTVVVTAAALITYRMLRGKGKEVPIGGAHPGALAAPIMINVKTMMMVLVSIAVLGASFYIILSREYDSDSEKWAFGVVGTIVGFWLRPEK